MPGLLYANTFLCGKEVSLMAVASFKFHLQEMANGPWNYAS